MLGGTDNKDTCLNKVDEKNVRKVFLNVVIQSRLNYQDFLSCFISRAKRKTKKNQNGKKTNTKPIKRKVKSQNKKRKER